MAVARLSNNKKKKIAALVEQASRAFASRRFDISDQLCRKIEALQPGHPDVVNMRAIICSQRGQADEAETLFMDAIKAAPKRSAFHANLGGLHLTQRRHMDALQSYRQAMELDANSLSAQFGYCTALIEVGCYEDAYAILDKARTRHPHDPQLLMGLFCACCKSNRLAEARECLNTVLKSDPNHAEAHYELGMLDIEAGQLDEGASALRATLRIRPDHAPACAALAKSRRYTSREEEDIKTIASLYARSGRDSVNRATLGFAMGKIMDDLGDYDTAFDHFKEANEIRRKQSRYDNDRELANMQAIMQAYTSETLSRTSGLDDATPVFIVGMPRCGSTLIEQILAAHPDIGSKGEWCFFENRLLFDYNSEENPPTPERLASFTPEQWQTVGQTFLENMKASHPTSSRITDKSLRNMRLIGAIHCALPKARIIHVRRNPLDTCLSIYKTNLQDRLFDYGCSLGELGYYYRMYLRLMQHWREVLPPNVMYELDYETLVTNQEEETRKLLDACGLDWDAQCLEFHQARNTVRTASITQVRRSMYKDSLAGWKRYEKNLQPLIRILGTEYVENST